jgi:flagellin-like hook-associated protein FlgL
MRVTFSQTFRNGLLDVNMAAARLAERTRQMSSGKLMHAASDNPGAMSSSISQHTEMAVMDQYVKQNDSVESRLTVADSSLTDMVKQITAAQGRGVGGRSTVLTPTQRDALAQEIRGSRDAILRGINTSFNGMYLFSGGRSTTPPYAPGTPISAYQGDSNETFVDVTRGRAVQVTYDGQSIIQGGATNDLFQTLTNLADAVQTGNMAGIDSSMLELNTAFDRVTTAQSGIGIELASLADDRSRTTDLRRAADKRRSMLEDANLAESISATEQASQAHQAALTALNTAGRLSLMDYLK